MTWPSKAARWRVWPGFEAYRDAGADVEPVAERPVERR
jgi:hypothetical protein